MNDIDVKGIPVSYPKIKEAEKRIGFTMPSDLHVGSLLKTLISSKPQANVLELGTGIGLSLAWMIDGLTTGSKLISLDNNPQLIDIATEFFRNDERVRLICTDGSGWLKNYEGDKFDLIFADAWPGKYSEIEKTLDLVKLGGFYVVDDMTEQPNWPDGHERKVRQLITYFHSRTDFNMTKMNWSTGIIIMTKIAS